MNRERKKTKWRRSSRNGRQKEKNQTSIDSAACLMRRRKETFKVRAMATEPRSRHTNTGTKSIGKLWRAHNECDGMGRVSLLILILVISLGCDAMPTTYKCIFYLSDLQFKEVRSLRLMKNYWQRKHAVVAHRFSRYRRRRRCLSLCLLSLLLPFISNRNISESLIGRMKFM